MSLESRSALDRYRDDRSEAAFREVVEAHLDHVYAVALRRCGGRADWAQEVTQAVFCELARKAGSLPQGTTPGGWLHRCAVYKSSEIRRAESRRRRHEQEAARHFDDASPPAADDLWTELAPVLDEALAKLPRRDRDALVLRFYERRNLREVGAALGATEDTAQKRVARALQRLRAELARRGITSTAGALGSVLATSAVTAAPAGLASAVTPLALTSVATAGGVAATFFSTLTLMTTKTKLTLTAAGIGLVLALPLCFQQHTIHRQAKLIDELSHRLVQAEERVAAAAPRSPVARPAAAASAVEAAVATVASDGVAGLEKILKEQDPVKRLSAFTAFLQTMSADEAPAVAGLFAKLTDAGASLQEEARLFLRAWGGVDGPGPLAVMEKHHVIAQKRATVLSGWAARDPHAALAWLETQPAGEAAETLARGLAEGWAVQDLDAAARWVETRPSSEARKDMIENLFRQYVTTRGIEGAKEWFASMTPNEQDPSYQQRAFNDIASHLAKTDLAQARQWLDDHAGQPWAGGGGVKDILQAWVKTDPPTAIEWALAHPEIRTRGDGWNSPLGAAVYSWAEADPNAAGQWLGTQTGTSGYDQAAASFVKGITDVDPESGFAWAKTIQDPSLRSESLVTAGVKWMLSQPEQARAALQAEGLQANISQTRSVFRDEVIERVQIHETRGAGGRQQP